MCVVRKQARGKEGTAATVKLKVDSPKNNLDGVHRVQPPS
jgi:hypothetical protein